jgi:hypothetical protein
MLGVKEGMRLQWLVGNSVADFCEHSKKRRYTPRRSASAMKKIWLLVLLGMVASASWAKTRDWKDAMVISTSETDISGDLRAPKNTLHYTIETEDMVYFVDYSYKPIKGNQTGAPDIAVNVATKIAVEGKHAYVLDTIGREVKLRVTKQMKR